MLVKSWVKFSRKRTPPVFAQNQVSRSPTAFEKSHRHGIPKASRRVGFLVRRLSTRPAVVLGVCVTADWLQARVALSQLGVLL